jgi:hypothetical protein
MEPALGFWPLAAIFSFKTILACLYGYIFLHYYHGDDTWAFFKESIDEYKNLVQHPTHFFNDFLPYSAFAPAKDFWQGMGFYIQDLEFWIMVKLLAIFNIFSRGNYYIDALFFQFLTVWGPLYLFRLFASNFPDRRNFLLAAILFVPMVVFWLSGIRAEGLLICFLSMILYYGNKWFKQKKISYMIWVMIGFFGMLIFRMQFLLVFLPALVAWTLSLRSGKRAIYYFFLIYIISIFIFFGSAWISPLKNLPAAVATSQKKFLGLHGNTRFRLDSLDPTLPSYIKVLPQALSNTMIRPLITDARGALQIATSFDLMGVWILIALALFFHRKDWWKILSNPLILFCLAYGISQILLVGYVVPFPGAIVRYKAIPEMFLIISLVMLIDWGRIHIKFN